MPSRITQAYVSKSISDFPFHQIYSLDDYNNNEIPSVFFGAYRYEDIQVINNHKSERVILWTGQDVINYLHYGFFIKPSLHVTAHPKVYDLLIKEFPNVRLVKPASFLNDVTPQLLGQKIYAYCPNSAPIYHGSKIINELRCGGYEITIGDGQWTQDQWKNGKADQFYNEVGIGLCLSGFAGGGTSIIEMGLRGIPVITNVFELPHCHKWKDAQDVAGIIERLKLGIGKTNTGLANLVWNELDHEYRWLEYDEQPATI